MDLFEYQAKELFAKHNVPSTPGRVTDSAEEAKAIAASDARARGATQIELQFADGERVVGLTTRFPPVRRFFYVVPADANSNNLRILVNRSAVQNLGQPAPAMG